MGTLVELDSERVSTAWLEPINRWQGAPNSIHTDSVAQKIGMRGGTIPGTVHLAHFGPLLTELVGDRWLTSGSISMFYTYATVDREEVRAIVKAPPRDRKSDFQLDAWVETREGRVVCKGSVAVGKPDAVSYVRNQPLENAPAGACRILRQMTLEMALPAQDDYVMTEGGENGIVRDPQHMYRAMMGFPKGVSTAPAVGFFGATEVRLHKGPIRIGVPYRKSGRVICVGASPKTEFAWYDAELRDANNDLVADMRHMTRWMKVSSPLWSAEA